MKQDIVGIKEDYYTEHGYKNGNRSEIPNSSKEGTKREWITWITWIIYFNAIFGLYIIWRLTK